MDIWERADVGRGCSDIPGFKGHGKKPEISVMHLLGDNACCLEHNTHTPHCRGA